jgi:acyl-CoA reductase-like NAD-dependent aldehyde dehydrogenase
MTTASRDIPSGDTSGATIEVVDPSTEVVISSLADVGVEGVDDAVHRAAAAFGGWRAVSPSERAGRMRALAAALRDEGESLATTESANVGKPISSSRGEVSTVADVFDFYAGAIDKFGGRTLSVAGGLAFTMKEPIGVVGAITPWNFPLLIASWKVAPALAAGNTVVLKPSELTPLTSIRLAALAEEVGLGDGVLQVAVGRGDTAGRALATHRLVDKVSFTGSTRVGRQILAGAADSIKRVSLELGGKSATVVFADADIDAAAAAAPMAVFDNAGQDCCARSRILVESSAYDRFVDRLIAATASVRVARPADDGDMGPLISRAQHDKVGSFLDSDATVLYAGSCPSGTGYWFPPTIVDGGHSTSRLMTEEIFGPVVAVAAFTDEDDAVRLANSSIYGLSGSVWTRDGAKALRVAGAIRSGTLSVNSNSSVRTAMPFGGLRQSGLGSDLGMEAMDIFSTTKSVFVSTQR